ncbi:hypothetical protein KIN20_024019 [Parelaphostrongylus tenuis]|uniref:Uncharacterized protein n=1 Tax=Parelaphostrongylus tenuis TaxID=148309 RepID=A0AAD5QTC2_PARTN|nr:hypothetical protein KIN20_024019 [Parelaphostrongylus tenuis]
MTGNETVLLPNHHSCNCNVYLSDLQLAPNIRHEQFAENDWFLTLETSEQCRKRAWRKCTSSSLHLADVEISYMDMILFTICTTDSFTMTCQKLVRELCMDLRAAMSSKCSLLYIGHE